MIDIIDNKIEEIIKVVHLNEPASNPLRLYFNLENINGNKSAFAIGITDDGESIFFKHYSGPLSKKDIANEIDYGDVIAVERSNDIYRLVGQVIVEVSFGNGIAEVMNDNQAFIKRPVLYYFKLSFTKGTFLFFNDGDEGYYSFDKIEEILAKDIYTYSWEPCPP